jgi:DNA-binding transcriptional MerR regulator
MKAAESGLREFRKVAAKGWDDEVSLDELLVRVNRVASKLFPAGEATDSRISPTFVPRSFRHYVTFGCIDPGRREGRRSVYGLRHFLQALLVRRLLSEGVSSRRMPELVTGGSNEDLQRMILDGVEVVVRTGRGDDGPAPGEPHSGVPGPPETWNRTCVAPGVELHLREGLPRLKPAERRKLIERLEAVLKGYALMKLSVPPVSR